jgi:hypothetical protein
MAAADAINAPALALQRPDQLSRFDGGQPFTKAGRHTPLEDI